MSSRQQIDSVIDDDDEFWYVYEPLKRRTCQTTNPPQVPSVSKSSTCRTRTSGHVPVDIRYVKAIGALVTTFWWIDSFPVEALTRGITDLPVLLQQHQNPQRRRSMPELSSPLRRQHHSIQDT